MTRTLSALLPAVVLALIAAPAIAHSPLFGPLGPSAPDIGSLPDGFSHAVEGRFGVVSVRDGATGRTRAEPVAGVNFRMNWVMQADAGWRVGVTLDLGAGNLPDRRRAALRIEP